MSPFLQYGKVQLLNVPHAADLADESIARDCYELRSLEGQWAVADIGACYGEFAYFAKSLGHVVLAAEPSLRSFAILTLNGYEHYQLDYTWQRMVVGGEQPNEKMPHFYREDHPAASGPPCDPGIKNLCRWITMSDVVGILRIHRLPIFVKMDCEGAEVEIFEHIDTWIDGVSAVSMETHNYDADVFGSKLEKRGFECKLLGTSPYPLPAWDKTMAGGLVIARKPI